MSGIRVATSLFTVCLEQFSNYPQQIAMPIRMKIIGKLALASLLLRSYTRIVDGRHDTIRYVPFESISVPIDPKFKTCFSIPAKE